MLLYLSFCLRDLTFRYVRTFCTFGTRVKKVDLRASPDCHQSDGRSLNEFKPPESVTPSVALRKKCFQRRFPSASHGFYSVFMYNQNTIKGIIQYIYAYCKKKLIRPYFSSFFALLFFFLATAAETIMIISAAAPTTQHIIIGFMPPLSVGSGSSVWL